MVMKGTSAGTSADLLLIARVCVSAYMCIRFCIFNAFMSFYRAHHANLRSARAGGDGDDCDRTLERASESYGDGKTKTVMKNVF